jgi:hypothetical protein
MTLIIPGVEVKIAKEVSAPQLSPSGVLGLVGFVQNPPAGGAVCRAASWSSFVEALGPATAFSLPEAAQALGNGVFELVVCPLAADAGTKASLKIPAEGGDAFTLEALVPGTWANGVKVFISPGKVSTKDAEGKDVEKEVFDLEISLPNSKEVLELHRNLSVSPEDERYVNKIINQNSRVVNITTPAEKIPKASQSDTNQPEKKEPYLLASGTDANRDAYKAALAKLEDHADVDMVLAAVQDLSDPVRLAQIYSDIISHCNAMSTKSQGRLGFGQIPGTDKTQIMANAEKMVNALASDRFVLVAPQGVVGAVAGMVGGLEYFQSPTFKRMAVNSPKPVLGVETQQELLKKNAVPIVEQKQGIIVIRGLTTDGDQISVRRVADHAVRGVKAISELFIGRLNNESGRTALKQKLAEFLVQMEKESAIVPSTDGKDPAFKVNVYSSQADFAQGIVRVEMAVRPVRAIDYIYATVLVQV